MHTIDSTNLGTFVRTLIKQVTETSDIIIYDVLHGMKTQQYFRTSL